MPLSTVGEPLTEDQKLAISTVFAEELAKNIKLTKPVIIEKMARNTTLKDLTSCPSSIKRVANYLASTQTFEPCKAVDQLLEPSERHDKSLNLADDFSKNHVSNSILNPPNLNPKFPSLPKMRGFKIAFLNICSLTCHYDELCVFMEDRAIDILGLNETRLDNTIADSQFDIEGYDIIKK